MSGERVKLASELRDHDVIVGHGMVDWTVGGPFDTILVHVHSGDYDRGSYTISYPRSKSVRYTRP